MSTPTAEPTFPPAGARVLAAAFLVLLAVLPYTNAVSQGSYVADDAIFLRDNPHASALGTMLTTGWTRPLWNLHQPAAPPVNPYYRPLTVTLFALTHAVDPSARTHHLVNVLLHAIAVLLLAHLLARRVPPAVAWIAAALFALHPIHTEAVTWISGAMAPLAAILCLVTLALFDVSRHRAGLRWLAGFTCWLALLSYEAAVAVLPLAVLMDGSSPLRPPLASTFRRLVPLIVGLCGVFVMRCIVFESWIGGAEHAPRLDLGVWRSFTLRVEVLGEGLRILLWPAELVTYREIDPAGADPTRLVIAALGLTTIGFALICGRNGVRLGAAWFLLALAPLAMPSGLGRFPFSERFFYLPSMGLALLLAVLASKALRSRAGCMLATTGGIALAALATCRIRERNRDYTSEERFRAAALAIEPRTPQLLAEELAASLRSPASDHPFFEREALHEERLRWANAILDSLDDRIVTNNDLGPVLHLARSLAATGDTELLDEVTRRTGAR